MSDEITLRATPGRDSTAAEIARNRGEFRRQPHLVVTTQSVPTEPVALPDEPQAAEPPTPASGTGEYGRNRLEH